MPDKAADKDFLDAAAHLLTEVATEKPYLGSNSSFNTVLTALNFKALVSQPYLSQSLKETLTLTRTPSLPPHSSWLSLNWLSSTTAPFFSDETAKKGLLFSKWPQERVVVTGFLPVPSLNLCSLPLWHNVEKLEQSPETSDQGFSEGWYRNHDNRLQICLPGGPDDQGALN